MHRRSVFTSLVLLLAACSGVEDPSSPSLAPLGTAQKKTEALSQADLEKVLVIRHPSVVNDPVRTVCNGPSPKDCGPWTFGAVMASLAGTNDRAAVSAMTLSWLSKWEQNQTVNGFTVPARPGIVPLVKTPWLQASGGSQLDFSRAPFRLLAIASRVDLRASDFSDAGEGRLIFGVLDAQGNPTQFTVIFEYRLIAPAGCSDVSLWAWAWVNLLSKQQGTEEYNSWLQVLTDHFATIAMDPSRPNGSSINQVRTNEIALSGPWELREFQLVCPGGARTCSNATLEQVTVKQTPHQSFNGSTTLASYLNQNQAAILAGTHQVPATFMGSPFLSGSAPVVGPWSAPGVTPAVRSAFALSTCDGCHQAETFTGFLHVSPRTQTGVAQFSNWLTSVEFPRREADYFNLVQQLAEAGCLEPARLLPKDPRPTH